MTKRSSSGSWGYALAVFFVACATEPTATPSDGASQDGGGAPCGRDGPLCEDGRECEGAVDCTSRVCRSGSCRPARPANGAKDGDETDTDCGGSQSPACADGKQCLGKDDCVSSVCASGICQAPNDHDGVRNGDETDVDCGGANAPKCATGKGCASTADCDAVKCDDTTKKCLPPGHDDGIKNGGETGVDCGGTASKKCPTGEGCDPEAGNADCDNVVCNVSTKVCDPPSPTDKMQNGSETDVDCGGGVAAKCKIQKKCLVDSDCASDVCNYAHKCVEAPSCRVELGGDTCGAGEVEQQGAERDSCCKSIALPGNTGRLDKYEITAGRMREFLRAVGNNVQKWVTDHPTQAQHAFPPDSTLVQYLPTSNREPHVDLKINSGPAVNRGFGVYDHLGNSVFFEDRPSAFQGCWVGSAPSQIGHPTYYFDKDTQKNEFGAAQRKFSQEELDVKSLNCVTQILLEAFCAWDGGGRLPTFAELGANSTNSAWGTATYPWGASPSIKQTTSTDPAVCPNIIPYPQNGTYSLVPMPTNYEAAARCNPTNVNAEESYDPSWPQVRYAWPPITGAGNDTAFLVAAPGRMRNDYRAIAGQGDGFYDVGGNLLEATHDFEGTDDPNHNSLPRTRWVGGSFEGHSVGRAYHNYNVLVKYGKTGGRCWRP
ncbi:MAG TPA: hypothetical protein VM580_07735 [Labilithrix sp.]|nr:hypothetical protein [Labilithrix sp.]